jgi:predicted nucleic acid-binding protein
MSATSPGSRDIVIDANLGVWAVLPLPDAGVLEHLARWRRQDRRLVAPGFWLAEVVSALRRSLHLRVISSNEGEVALEGLLALDVEMIPLDAPMCRAALRWAARLGHSRAYDGFYLALAERLAAELWTGDQRLAHGAQQVGATWVHWIGETL